MALEDNKYELHELRMREGELYFTFLFQGETYGGTIELEPFEGKRPQDITTSQRERFIQDTLYQVMMLLRDLRGEVEEDETDS